MGDWRDWCCCSREAQRGPKTPPLAAVLRGVRRHAGVRRRLQSCTCSIEGLVHQLVWGATTEEHVDAAATEAAHLSSRLDRSARLRCAIYATTSIAQQQSTAAQQATANRCALQVGFAHNKRYGSRSPRRRAAKRIQVQSSQAHPSAAQQERVPACAQEHKLDCLPRASEHTPGSVWKPPFGPVCGESVIAKVFGVLGLAEPQLQS